MSLAGLSEMVKDMPDAERKALMQRWLSQTRRDEGFSIALAWTAILVGTVAVLYVGLAL
jgi:hypothetical protein